jgi:serine/threonine protein kinase
MHLSQTSTKYSTTIEKIGGCESRQPPASSSLIVCSHIFLELAIGGDLFTYITAGGHQDCHLDEDESKYISFQLMKGLEYMHDLHVSHRGESNSCTATILVKPMYFWPDLKVDTPFLDDTNSLL